MLVLFRQWFSLPIQVRASKRLVLYKDFFRSIATVLEYDFQHLDCASKIWPQIINQPKLAADPKQAAFFHIHFCQPFRFKAKRPDLIILATASALIFDPL